MKQLTELIILTSLLIITKSASDVEFEEDFIHSFLIKSEKLSKSERLKTADSNWLESGAYKVNNLENCEVMESEYQVWVLYRELSIMDIKI